MTAPVKDIEKQRKAIEKKLDRLTDLYVDGQIDKPEYLKRKESFLTELDALVMPVEAPESPVLGFDAVDGINLYKQLGDEEKRLFWRRIIREITFNQNKEMKVYFL